MSDISKSVIAATSSSRYTEPIYCRDPASGTAFKVEVELPQNRMRSMADLGEQQIMPPGASQPLLNEVASLKYGTTPGLIERYNSQRVVSLTANIHNKALGQAGDEVNAALKRAGEPPRGVAVKLRGQIPPLKQTISGLRIGLLLAGLGLFFLLSANFQSIPLALGIVLTVPAV